MMYSGSNGRGESWLEFLMNAESFDEFKSASEFLSLEIKFEMSVKNSAEKSKKNQSDVKQLVTGKVNSVKELIKTINLNELSDFYNKLRRYQMNFISFARHDVDGKHQIGYYLCGPLAGVINEYVITQSEANYAMFQKRYYLSVMIDLENNIIQQMELLENKIKSMPLVSASPGEKRAFVNGVSPHELDALRDLKEEFRKIIQDINVSINNPVAITDKTVNSLIKYYNNIIRVEKKLEAPLVQSTSEKVQDALMRGLFPALPLSTKLTLINIIKNGSKSIEEAQTMLESAPTKTIVGVRIKNI